MKVYRDHYIPDRHETCVRALWSLSCYSPSCNGATALLHMLKSMISTVDTAAKRVPMLGLEHKPIPVFEIFESVVELIRL